MAPDTAAQHVSSYTVEVDGARIAKEYADRVREVRVVTSLASPDVCTVKVLFSKPRDAGDPWSLDDMPFEIGKKLTVKLGQTASQSPTTLFAGDVLTVEPEFGSGGVQVQVRAMDSAHKLHRARNVRSFQNQTVSDIVSKICQEAGLSVQSDASGNPLKYLQQSNETDWDFIQRLAAKIGFEFVVVDGTAKFRKPKKGDTVTLTYPDSLFQFHPRVTAVQQIDQVDVRAWDPATKREIAAQASSPDLLPEIGITRDAARKEFHGAKLLVATEPVEDQSQATKAAQALLDRMANGYAIADGLTFGNPQVRAGALVEIKGVGTRFGGKYPVHTAIHTLKGGGVYETHFTSSPDYTIAGMVGGGGGSGAGAPAFGDGLVVGIVTNNNDPDKMGRVRVKYPALSSTVEGWWARVCVPSSGKERGLMMLPQVDEEVLVGFEHGDVTRPYVVGSLFNGKDTPGDVLAAQDGSLGVRSDKKLITNSKQSTELTSEDVFKLKSGKDFTLTSDQKLDLKASGAATFKADQSLELSGTQSVKVSTQGGQLQIQAPTGSLEISAMNIKLSATGTVQISGATIMLG
ncbi:MAG: hypothetical protein QOF49_733 [Chloroflexota bacterium]|jgi:uncharacterized protein involved in type VI secretion and phage assembly|nr:hypothetical protein [Chloroflexota bacterium]